MRTTLDIDREVLAAARTLAAEQHMSVGAALSALARRGLQGNAPSNDDGLPVFAVDSDVAPITPAMVREAAEES